MRHHRHADGVPVVQQPGLPLGRPQGRNEEVRPAFVDVRHNGTGGHGLHRAKAGVAVPGAAEATVTALQTGAGGFCRALPTTKKIHPQRALCPRCQPLHQIGAGHALGERHTEQASEPQHGHAIGRAEVADHDRFTEAPVAEAANEKVQVGCGEEQSTPTRGRRAHMRRCLRQGNGVNRQPGDAVEWKVSGVSGCLRVKHLCSHTLLDPSWCTPLLHSGPGSN